MTIPHQSSSVHNCVSHMSNILDYLVTAPASMPMPGEAAAEAVRANRHDHPDTPSQLPTSTPRYLQTSPLRPLQTSPTRPRFNEGRRVSRRRILEVVASAQRDVDSFLRELAQKRCQLDDHIPKFIAQKEREFKTHEREVRTRYRISSAPSI
ncbi:hypothetical protein E4T44_02988 [Aureobasidium sp. EXF-8845]|nr:hypothetical protein E4T44_02988 [Aureobasidium sp. EXF-8845]KAI4855480.1 hypothetical protein E4T45_03079 [Aureobasidium sp. EXF-8846]